MTLNKLRWLTAGLLSLAALVTSANPSRAAFEVTITEMGVAMPLFSGTISGNVSTVGGITNENNAQATGASSNYTVTINPASSTGNLAASITTNYTITASGSLNLANAPALTVTVKDVGPLSSGLTSAIGSSAFLTNNVSVTSGILTSNGLGVNGVSSTTSVTDFNNPSLTIGSTGPDNAASPGIGFAQSMTNLSNLTNSYVIEQQFVIQPTGSGTILAPSFGGGISSTVAVSPASVPAPGGLLLAAFALPVFGVRRFLRRKAAQ